MNAMSAASNSASDKAGALAVSLNQMARQAGQKLGVDGAKETLDLAASLRSADGRMDQFDLQRRRDLFEMVAGEVAPVIDVENIGNPMHRPCGIRLAPDRLPQGQGVCRADGAPRNAMYPAIARE